ncbi:unnamed protein product, partial [Protopolystoma xenopodis]
PSRAKSPAPHFPFLDAICRLNCTSSSASTTAHHACPSCYAHLLSEWFEYESRSTPTLLRRFTCRVAAISPDLSAPLLCIICQRTRLAWPFQSDSCFNQTDRGVLVSWAEPESLSRPSGGESPYSIAAKSLTWLACLLPLRMEIPAGSPIGKDCLGPVSPIIYPWFVDIQRRMLRICCACASIHLPFHLSDQEVSHHQINIQTKSIRLTAVQLALLLYLFPLSNAFSKPHLVDFVSLCNGCCPVHLLASVDF